MTPPDVTDLKSTITDLRSPLPLLKIDRWSEVFETSKSRNYETGLNWTSHPTNFNSTGYQKLVEDFEGLERAAVYGAWCSLIKLVAQFKRGRRGLLAGEKGEPFTVSRIARQCFMPPEPFQLLIPWAVEAGWLVPVRRGDLLEGVTPETVTAADDTGNGDGRSGGRVTWPPDLLQEDWPAMMLEPIAPDAAALPDDITKKMEHSVFGGINAGWLSLKGSKATDLWKAWLAFQWSTSCPVIFNPRMADAVFCLAAVLAVNAKRSEDIRKKRVALLVSILSARDVTPIQSHARKLITLMKEAEGPQNADPA